MIVVHQAPAGFFGYLLCSDQIDGAWGFPDGPLPYFCATGPKGKWSKTPEAAVALVKSSVASEVRRLEKMRAERPMAMTLGKIERLEYLKSTMGE
jgi:hypothetical protein